MLRLIGLAVLVVAVGIVTFVPFENAFSMSSDDHTLRDPDALSNHGPRQASGGTNYVSIVFDAIVRSLAKRAGSELQKLSGLQTLTCCDGWLDSCLFNAGTTKDGHGLQSYFIPGKERIIDADVDMMKCIIDLHYRQPDKCIDIKGSHCGNGYGGGLMKGKIKWLRTKAIDPQYQISDEESRALQAAAESMRNLTIDYKTGGNLAISLVNMTYPDKPPYTRIDFTGHQGWSC